MWRLDWLYKHLRSNYSPNRKSLIFFISEFSCLWILKWFKAFHFQIPIKLLILKKKKFKINYDPREHNFNKYKQMNVYEGCWASKFLLATVRERGGIVVCCVCGHTRSGSVGIYLFHSQDRTVFNSYIICLFKVTLSEKSHQIIKDAFNDEMFLWNILKKVDFCHEIWAV